MSVGKATKDTKKFFLKMAKGFVFFLSIYVFLTFIFIISQIHRASLFVDVVILVISQFIKVGLYTNLAGY